MSIYEWQNKVNTLTSLDFRALLEQETSKEANMPEEAAYELTAGEKFVQSVEAPAKELLKQFLAEHIEYTGCCYRIEGENAHLRTLIWRVDEKKLSDKERELLANCVTRIYDLFPVESRSYLLVPWDKDQVRYLIFPTVRQPRA